MDESIRSSKAYGLFFSEVQKYLNQAADAFETPSTIDAEMLPRLSAAFHTVKGGAGFFGLHSLAEQAGELEDLLNTSQSITPDVLNKASTLFLSFQELAKSLPEPQAE